MENFVPQVYTHYAGFPSTLRPNNGVMSEAQLHSPVYYLDPKIYFFYFCSISKKIVKADKVKRCSLGKLSSKILTSTTLEENLEGTEEKRKLQEKKLKKQEKNCT